MHVFVAFTVKLREIWYPSSLRIWHGVKSVIIRLLIWLPYAWHTNIEFVSEQPSYFVPSFSTTSSDHPLSLGMKTSGYYAFVSAFFPGMSKMHVRCPISATPSCPISLKLSGGRRIFGPVLYEVAWHGYNILPVGLHSATMMGAKVMHIVHSVFCVCIPGRSRVRGRTVRD
jgi:hypothetical protein